MRDTSSRNDLLVVSQRRCDQFASEIMNSALLTEEDEQLLQFVLPTGFEDESDRECKKDQLASLRSGGWLVCCFFRVDSHGRR